MLKFIIKIILAGAIGFCLVLAWFHVFPVLLVALAILGLVKLCRIHRNQPK